MRCISYLAGRKKFLNYLFQISAKRSCCKKESFVCATSKQRNSLKSFSAQLENLKIPEKRNWLTFRIFIKKWS